MNRLAQPAVNDEPAPVTQVMKLDQEDSGYHEIPDFVRFYNQALIIPVVLGITVSSIPKADIAVSSVSPIELEETTRAPVSESLPIQPEQTEQVEFSDYTPPLVADRRLFMNVKKGEQPDLDWEL